MKIKSGIFLFLSVLLSITTVYAGNSYYLITHGSQDPYWLTLFSGAKQAAKDLNVDLQILAPAGANDVAKQKQFLDSAIATQPQGIATTLPSDTAFAKSLQKAKKLNIPVLAFDTQPQDLNNNPYLAFLGADNELMGKVLANKALAMNAIKQHAVILNPQPGHIGLEARARGIKAILKAKAISVDEIEVGVDGGKVQARVKAYFANHPHTEAVFCLTSQALDPLGQLLLHPDKNNFNYHPTVFSFDKTPNTLSLMQKGKVEFAIDQQPFMMGYLSITQLVLLNRYQLIPVNMNTSA